MVKRFFSILTIFFLLTGGPAFALCEVLIQAYEKKHNMPHKLLQAVALAESGRSVPGQGMVAWPWTINAEGAPYVLETKAEAIAKVKELKRQGIQSIDVGCMQINLKHHPEAFASLEEAFDPEHNIAYAAEFLTKKKMDQGGWLDAVAHYHSANASVNAPYKNRVYQIWDRVKNAADTLMETLTPPVLKDQLRPKLVHGPLSGRRLPLNVRYSTYGGRLPPVAANHENANHGGIALSKRFLNIKPQGKVIGKGRGQGEKVRQTAAPGGVRLSLQPARKIFKLS